MKIHLYSVLLILTAACSSHPPKDVDRAENGDAEKSSSASFEAIKEFPRITDTTQFIQELREVFDLEVDISPGQNAQEKITSYQKVSVYGSEEDYFFIEYDYKKGSMASYPWKYQLLLRSNGTLLKKLSGQRFEFVRIFPEQNPFLLLVVATSKGNGGHEIYKVTSDTLENVYEGYLDYKTKTYDAHQDIDVFEPHELRIAFEDINQDGFNDLVFSGTRVMLGKTSENGDWYDGENGVAFSVENPAAKIPLQYVFLYDRDTEHFKEP